MKIFNFWKALIPAMILLGSGCLPIKHPYPAQSATLQVSTSTNPATSTPHVEIAKVVEFDENYMHDCRTLFPEIFNQQVDFQSLYPGLSTRQQIIDRLGQPQKQSESGDELVYYDSVTDNYYNVFIKEEVLSYVTVESAHEMEITLQTVLEKYGCPDLITVSVSGDGNLGNPKAFYGVFFTYLSSGMWFLFDGFPVSFSTHAVLIGYRSPISADDYFQEAADSFASGILILATYSESVK
jgi:hypothetical protein